MNERDYCPHCRSKLSVDNFYLRSFICQNQHCTSLGTKDLHYCYTFSSIIDAQNIIAWGVSITTPNEVYYLRSFSKEYFEENKGHFDRYSSTTLSDEEDHDILEIPIFTPYPTNNIYPQLFSVCERLRKLALYS